MSTARTAKFKESIKKEMLELLAKGYGVKATCQKLGVSRPTYYNWRKADKQFDHQCERVLSDPAHKDRILKSASRTDTVTDAPWQDKFLRRYRVTGDKGEAATLAGKDSTFIKNALTPESSEYDMDFHMRYKDEEQRRVWLIEDNLFKKAEHDGPSARFVLSNLMKEKYGKVEGSVTVTNQHWFTQHGKEQADDFLGNLFPKDKDGDQLGDQPSGSDHSGLGEEDAIGGKASLN